MSNPTTTGQDLIDSLRIRLGGLANAFTVDKCLSLLNDGVTEVWSVIRSLDGDYFGASSQDTTSANDDFFLDLSATVREYDLPKNCRELRAIECLAVGFEDRVFQFRRFDDPEFQAARRFSTAGGASASSSIANYLYTIFGNQFLLAQFPEATLKLKLWYIKSIDEIDTTAIPEILFPFNKKIVDYAAERAMLSTQNESLSQAWMVEWKDDVRTLAMSTGSRTSTNATFASDYLGG